MDRLRYICFIALAAVMYAFCYEKQYVVVSNTIDLQVTYYKAEKFQVKTVFVKKNSKQAVFKKHKKTRIWTQQFPFVLPDVFQQETVAIIVRSEPGLVYTYPYYPSSSIYYCHRGPPVSAV